MNTLIETKHSEMVAALIKPGEEILKSLTPSDCHLWHMITLLTGEAGELSEAIKKAVVYRRDLDFVNVLEELGDLEFAISAIREIFGFNREEVLTANIAKLSVRYSSGKYSDAQARDRADKTPSIEDELGELEPDKACKIGDGTCESCQ